MAVYSINIERVNTPATNNLKWHLDFPVNEEAIDSAALMREGVLFQGWILPDEEFDFSLIILNGTDVYTLPIHRPRPDVVSKVLGESPEETCRLICGFSKRIKLTQSSFSLGMIVNGTFTELLVGSIDGKFKILKGKDGWLFLDNDSNKSVEQFNGKVKLSRTARKEWKHYLKSIDEYSTTSKIPTCLLIAPSKEMVVSEHYPYKESPNAPIYELIKMVPESLNFLYPVTELKLLKQRSFRVCDTHWTFHGARKASQLLASALSEKGTSAFEVFADDKYARRRLTGDLGSKLFPPRGHIEEALHNFNYRRTVIYDNWVDNFGRIIVMSHEEAVLKKTLLLFGSSSSYIMFHYLCRLFKQVVFVHTAGSVDHEILEVVKPDYLCLQTNARFVVQAPRFNDSVQEYINQKAAAGRIKKPEIANQIPDECQSYVGHFVQMWESKTNFESVS